MVKKILREINVTCNTAVIYLEVLKLPTYIQHELSFKKRGYNKDGKIAISQAQQLVRVEDSKYQQYLFERALGGTNAKRLQALVNEYKKKLEEGTWKGFEKVIWKKQWKNQVEKLEELSKESKRLSAKIRSFSVDTLIQLEETMEKEEFIISMKELKKELMLLRNKIDDKLIIKGFHELRKPSKPFVILVRPQSKGRQKEMRFTFPMEIVNEINLPSGKHTKLKLKVVSMKVCK